jgi:WD40 repeat protein/DNA-binding SARP family transcriptional activator/energy-coupling factor transporter ATP-binding protein EcfA2
MNTVRFGVLGPLEVTDGRGPIPLGGPKQRRLLAVLITRLGEPVSVDALVEAVWDGQAPRSATKTLQGYVVHLRRALFTGAGGTDAGIVTLPAGYRLDAAPEAVDAVRFTSLVAKGRQTSGAREWSQAKVYLEEALALWRGSAYAEFGGAEFAAAETARLGELRLVANETRLDVELALGEDAGLVPELSKALADQPTRERLWELLIRALYRAGRQSDALKAYLRAREILAEELGVEPGPALQAVHAAVLAQDPLLEHPGAAGAGRLPSQPTSGVYAFDGRGPDLSWLRAQWLAAIDQGGRVAVVSGAGGLGKTRLLRAFADDVARSACLVIRRTGLTAPAPATIAAVAAGRPALVVLDDPVTGLDPRALASFRILVVAAVDPVRAPEHVLASLGSAEWRELEPLPGDVCERIARRWVADDPEGVDLDPILMKAGGSPGYLHRMMAEALEQRSRRRIEASVTQLRSASADVAALRAGVMRGVRGLRRGRVLTTPEAGDGSSTGPLCPFRGLEAYGRGDAALFHGRDTVIGQLVARVAETALVAVVGGSGTGKSSVVQAGLLVSLADGCLPGSTSWPQHVVTPADVLPAPSQAPSVVVVDQFEQAWTVHGEERRGRYLDAVMALADAGHHVVLTLRTDHLDRCSEHPRLRGAVADGTVLLGPLGAEELTQVITGPAEFAGCEVEPLLVDRILAEVRGLPAPLPLLSTALLDTWERAADSTLTLDAYRRGGGVGGSLARRAEAVFAGLDPEEQYAARRVLLRLATGERGALVRRRCPYDEVAHDEPARGAVDALVSARLIIVDAGVVEVAHEALFENWPRLRDWLDEDEQGRRLRAHLAPAAQEWASGGRPDSELYRGVRLDAAEDWASQHAADLNQVERDFLTASLARADEELRVQRARATREARSRRRLRSILAAMTVAVATTISATVVAVRQQREATQLEHLAVARQLGASALVNQPLDHSLLMAVSALRLNDNVDTRSYLLAALQRSPAARTVVRGDGEQLRSFTVTGRSGIPVASTPTGRLLTWSPAGSRTPAPTSFFAPDVPVVLAARPATDQVVAAGAYDGAPSVPKITIWDARGVRQALPDLQDATRLVTSLAWTPDGRWLAAAQDAGDTLVWDFNHLDRPALHIAGDKNRGRLLAAVGSDAFAVVERSGAGKVWRPGVSAPLRTLSVDEDVTAVASNQNGSLLATGRQDGAVVVWSRSGRVHALTNHLGPVTALAFSSDGRLLASGGRDGAGIVSDPVTGRLLSRLSGHTDAVTGAAFTSDGRMLYASSRSGQVIGWDLAHPNNLARQISAPGSSAFTWMAVSATGELATVNNDSVRFWSAQDNDPPSRPIQVGDSPLRSGAFSPDGRLFATVEKSGAARLIDVPGRQLKGTLTYEIPGPALDVGFSPDGQKAVVAAADRDFSSSAYLVDIPTKSQDGAPIPLQWIADRISWGRNGRHIAATYQTNSVIGIGVYDLHTRIPLWSLQSTTTRTDWKAVSGFSWSPDGSTIATGDTAGRVRLWRATDGAPAGAGWQIPIRPLSLASSPDGRILASAGSEGIVILNDVATGAQIGPQLVASDHQNTMVRFDPSGHLIVATADGGLWRWSIDAPTMIRTACTIAGRNLTAVEWAELHTGYPYLTACPN